MAPNLFSLKHWLLEGYQPNTRTRLILIFLSLHTQQLLWMFFPLNHKSHYYAALLFCPISNVMVISNVFVHLHCYCLFCVVKRSMVWSTCTSEWLKTVTHSFIQLQLQSLFFIKEWYNHWSPVKVIKRKNMLWGEKEAVDALNQPDDSRIGELWRCQEHFIHTLSMLWMLWALCYCYEKYQPQYKTKLFLDSTV